MDRQASLANRAKDFTLAALATGYPSDEAFGTLRLLRQELSSHAGLAPIMVAADNGLDGLRAEYAEHFDVGRGHVPLYQTEYGRSRGLSKGRDLADVMAFYRAFGFELTEDGAAEMPDHIAIELEFYALLLHKQSLLKDDAEGSDIVAKARCAFLAEHLGAFASAIVRRPAVAAHPLFGPLFLWCAGLVEAECAYQGVTPAPLDSFAAKDADDEVSCGSSATDLLQLRSFSSRSAAERAP